MTLEMHMGARPGRPRLLLVLAAASLAVVLGLAWLQAAGARALGPEHHLPGTPLIVRAPRGWTQDPERPNRFSLIVEQRGERSISFHYLRLGSYVPPDQILPLLNLADAADLQTIRPARIGPYPAVAVLNARFQRVRWRLLRKERLVRIACLPHGDVVAAIYDPLFEIAPADEAFMEDVCAALRIDSAPSAPAEDLLAVAGVRLALQQNWYTVGPLLPDVPGVWLGGTEDDLPAWSLGIFRTWLAAGRRPADLLRDLAAEQWRIFEADDLIHEDRRPDGSLVATLEHPQPERLDGWLTAALVVEQAPRAAAVMLVYASPATAPAAREAAQRIAGTLEFTPLAALPPLADAEQAGQTLVAKLRTVGPVARWGREPDTSGYRARTPGGDDFVVVARQARQRNPRLGYEGTIRHWEIPTESPADRLATLLSTRKPSVIVSWTLDGHGATYAWNMLDQSGTLPIEIEEQRGEPDGNVQRTVTLGNARPRVWTYHPGPAFVPQPLEDVITGWVARGEVEAAICETSTFLGPGTCSVLARRLPPDGARPRVLVQRDYWPRGVVQRFDDDAAVVDFEQSPRGTYERVPLPDTPARRDHR